MHAMLPAKVTFRAAAGHDIGCRINAGTSRKRSIQCIPKSLSGKAGPSRFPTFSDELLPCRDSIKDFEKDGSEEKVGRRPFAVILNVTNQVLADPIRCTVSVGEAVLCEDWIFCP